ncbi:Crp/Fnr family transcriptional regulator [Pseudomonas moraviensis subsp. stanleyae]|uniref:Crp/Fnr family transcriptional regulator n=1 Tax=Pseudomonas moraviensis TaxID=321662 RepID=UPI002E329315|nr:Crp/Fnr family transcriptional regulator [Pseudomonas moraviensis]MED7666691.1 Crp/Fnr family transcriptional regulator [Pseudomonas moraviensis subsp. stanleyae]
MSGFNWIQDLSLPVRQAVLDRARLRTLPDSTTLYHQGDLITEVYQIVSGEIRQCIITADGQEVLIYIYKPGDLVGDSSIADQDPHSVTIITRGEAVLRVWSARDFTELRTTYTEVENAVAAQISRRLRGALRLVEELLTQPVAARIASRFFWLSDIQGASAEAANITLSQSDIGLMVGSTRQSVNRVVTELRKLDLIETNYGKVTVKDTEGLRRYISEHQRHGRNSTPE